MHRRTARWLVVLALFGVSVAASSQDVSAVPPPPSEFAAPETDPAGRVAREIARIVPHMPNLRQRRPHGIWRLDERARWSVRAEQDCLSELSRLGVTAQPFVIRTTPVPTPVRVESELGGVRYRRRFAAPDFNISCELAVRLAAVGPTLRAHGVHTVEVSSGLRSTPATSFHRMGLAIDVVAFHGSAGSWIVERDYTPDPRRPTCPPPDDAHPLRRLACDLHATGVLSTVITPSYTPGHRNHFHLDVRPDDPRVYVR